MTEVASPFPLFANLDGTLIEGASIYIGQPNADPEASPKAVFWDAALTVAADQPLRTIAGVVVRAGTPAKAYVDGAYSLRVRQRDGSIVFYTAYANDPIGSILAGLASGTGASQIGIALPGSATTVPLSDIALVTVPIAMFGVKADGSDQSVALQAAVDYVAAAGGGRLVFSRGATVTCTTSPIVKPGVVLDLNGSTLVLNLDGGNKRGVRLRSNSEVCNGTITVNSTGQPSLQAGVHSPVTVGPLYGDSPSIAQLSPDENVTGFRIRNLTLSTNKLVAENGSYPVGGVAIQIYGNASDWLIENITIPDSDRMFGAIHADWAPVGYIVSNDIAGSRAAFDAVPRAAYTTHPHGGIIRKITVGRLTRPVGGIEGGSHGIRLSGVYDVMVENVRAGATTYATVLHTGGDVGFEFANDVDRRQAYQNITIRDVSCADTGPDGRLGQSDTLADNVYRATINGGYSALLPMPHPTNMVMERIAGRASGVVGLNSVGIRVIQQRGGLFRDCVSVGHLIGHMIGDQAVDVTFERPQANLTRMEAVYVGEGSQTPPQRCAVIAPLVSLANRAGMGRPLVYVGRSNLTRVVGGTIGALDSETAKFGIQIDSAVNGCMDATIEGNPVIQGHASGGAALSVSSDEGWGALRLFRGASYGAGVTAPWVGLSIVPVAIEGAKRRSRADSVKLTAGFSTPPAGYPKVVGEVIEFNDPVVTGDTPPAYLAKTVAYPNIWKASS